MLESQMESKDYLIFSEILFLQQKILVMVKLVGWGCFDWNFAPNFVFFAKVSCTWMLLFIHYHHYRYNLWHEENSG